MLWKIIEWKNKLWRGVYVFDEFLYAHTSN